MGRVQRVLGCSVKVGQVQLEVPALGQTKDPELHKIPQDQQLQMECCPTIVERMCAYLGDNQYTALASQNIFPISNLSKFLKSLQFLLLWQKDQVQSLRFCLQH